MFPFATVKLGAPLIFGMATFCYTDQCVCTAVTGAAAAAAAAEAAAADNKPKGIGIKRVFRPLVVKPLAQQQSAAGDEDAPGTPSTQVSGVCFSLQCLVLFLCCAVLC